jgi:hypothetical protein
MEVIQEALNLVPVPGLSAAFSVFAFIVKTIEQVQSSKQQLHVLACAIADLLQALNSTTALGSSWKHTPQLR